MPIPNFPHVPPFRPFIPPMSLPAVYGDELSYMELLGKVEKWLTDVVESTNLQNAAIVALYAAWEAFKNGGYVESFEEFLDQWFADNQEHIDELLTGQFADELAAIQETADGAVQTATEAEQAVAGKVNMPDGGTNGQVLSKAATDTGTAWVDPIIPTDEQTETYINKWLNEHPEATTTVLDGSITTAKFSPDNAFFDVSNFEKYTYSGTSRNFTDEVPIGTTIYFKQCTDTQLFVFGIYEDNTGDRLIDGSKDILQSAVTEHVYHHIRVYSSTSATHTFEISVNAPTEIKPLIGNIKDETKKNAQDIAENSSDIDTLENTTETLTNRIDAISNFVEYSFDSDFISVYTALQSGAKIYFEQTSDATIFVFGMYGEVSRDGYDTLIVGVKGNLNTLTTNRAYNHIRLYSSVNETHTCRMSVTEATEDVPIVEANIDAINANANNIVGNTTDISTISNFKMHTYTGTSNNLQGEVASGTSLYFKQIGATTLYLFGMYDYGNENFDLLLTGVEGELQSIVTTRTYHHLRVYSTISETHSYILSQCPSDVFKPIIEGLKDTTNELTNRASLLSEGNKYISRIFKKVVCVGDSYTAGYVHLDGDAEYGANFDYAWPEFMSCLTGREWVNCGSSGATVLTWQTRSAGLPKAQSIGRVSAYVIGLGINDAEYYPIPLGTIDDIGTAAETYYGGMSAIIRELNAISPTAKIFVNTVPKRNTVYTGYNQAIRDIVDAYESTYPVFCIDLFQKIDMYEIPSLAQDYVHGHYTPIGYEQFAEIYNIILTQFIIDNCNSFQDVFKIPVD